MTKGHTMKGLGTRAIHALILPCSVAIVACSDTPTLVGNWRPELEPEPITGNPRIAFVSTREGWPYIYVADADGSNVTRLVYGEQPAWSWDGRYLAFVRNERIRRITFDGSDVRELGEGSDPAWSPQGTIAFRDGENQIGTMDAVGASRKTLVNSGFRDPDGCPLGLSAPAWSPDGRKIVFAGSHSYYYSSCDTPSSAQIFVLDVVEGESRLLAAIPDFETSYGSWVFPGGPLSWSPDGSTIAASLYDVASNYDGVMAGFSSESGEANIFLRRNWVANPDWSPDGRRLVVDLSTGVGRRIHVLSLETGEMEQLIPDVDLPSQAAYEDYDPSWLRCCVD